MKQRNAFSLVELMVVITIVAILSAFAIPSYNDYLQRAHMSRVLGVMTKIMNNAINYANTNRTFPNAAQLNLANDPANAGDDQYADPSAISPDVQWVQIQDVGACGRDLRISVGLSEASIVGGADFITMNLDVFNINGSFVPICTYTFNRTSGGGNSDYDLFPDCINNYNGTAVEWTTLNSQSTCL